MEIKRIVRAVFSPTGGTERVVGALTEPWKGEILDIDISDSREDFSRYILGGDDLLVAAVPSFSGRVPGVALERLKQLKGCGTPTVLVVTYGNRDYEDTVIELGDSLGAEGCIAIAAVTAVTEHSIVRSIAQGRPDEEDMQELRDFGVRILNKLKDMEELRMIPLPGNRPYKTGGGGGMVPEGDKHCDRCGLCATKCPVEAIPSDKPDTTDKDRCISCMRCVKLCHVNARRVSPILLNLVQAKLKKVCGVRRDNELMM